MPQSSALYDSPLNRLVELVQLLSDTPAEVAFDAVACSKLRHAPDVDPFTLVAESLLMLRPRALIEQRQRASERHVDATPAAISLTAD